MPTIAIVGAGPGMGLAIARTFGSRGFDVALISRTKEKLQTLVDQLGQEGITAAAFPADVLDRASLTDALDAAKARFGGIDVLEYSPAPHSPVPGFTLAAPSEVTVDNLQPQIEYIFYGAVAAAQHGAARDARGRRRHPAVHHRRRLGGSRPDARQRQRRRARPCATG